MKCLYPNVIVLASPFTGMISVILTLLTLHTCSHLPQ